MAGLRDKLDENLLFAERLKNFQYEELSILGESEALAAQQDFNENLMLLRDKISDEIQQQIEKLKNDKHQVHYKPTRKSLSFKKP